MRRFRLGALCVAAMLLTPKFAWAEASAPYEMMRALASLQDQIAAGNAIAQVGQVKLIERMAERFSTADPSVWMDKRNARALVLYLLGGGNASVLDGYIDKDEVAKDYEALFEGAMAYALGNDSKAKTLLLPIDARTLPSGLGGHLALVQATLVANQDQTRALQLLDLARLLEPGTLVEEAALRKELFLIGPAGDLNKSALLSRRYLHAFAKSIYAENFRQLAVKTAVEIGRGDNAASCARLDVFLSGLDPRERRAVLITLARNALLDGRFDTARFAASAAGKLSPKLDAEQVRANVYLGAASVVGDDYEAGVKILRTIDPSQLGESDAGLRASALEIATMIRSKDSTLDVYPVGDGGADQDGIKQTISDAERSLTDSQALLQGKNP